MNKTDVELTKKDFLPLLAYGKLLGEYITLNNLQYSKLSEDLKKGRAPVKIMGKLGYVGGDKVWTSVTEMNKLKKQGK